MWFVIHVYIIFRTTNQLLARMTEQCLHGGLLRSLRCMIIIFFITGSSVSIRVMIIWAIFKSLISFILENLHFFKGKPQLFWTLQSKVVHWPVLEPFYPVFHHCCKGNNKNLVWDHVPTFEMLKFQALISSEKFMLSPLVTWMKCAQQ